MMNIYEQLINLCPVGAAVILGDEIYNINPRGAALLEYTPEEMIGSSVREFFNNNTGISKSGRRIHLDIKMQDSESGYYTLIVFETRDALTDAMTREQFFDALQNLDGKYSLLFIDLNKFKSVNDTLGHLTGDLVLQTVSRRIQGMLRNSDLFCRYGGDEFLVAIPGEPYASSIVRDKIKEEALKPIQAGNNTVNISCSVGLALSTEADNINGLIEIADRRMYEEKHNEDSLTIRHTC